MKVMRLIDFFLFSMKSAKRFVFFIAVALCSVVSMHAKGSSTAIADSLYVNGKYSEAAEAYLAVEKIDGDSPGLLFNLANSYAQIGDMGRAILYYSRANRLAPTNKEIKNNLDYFTSKVEDSNRAELRGKKTSVVPDHATFFQSVNSFICAEFPQNMWAYIAAAAFIILLSLIAVYLFCSDVRLRKIGFFGGICSMFISIACIIFAFMSASYYDSGEKAVLMAYKTELLIEPSSDAKPSSNLLCQGTRFDIVAEDTDVEGRPTWYKVRLNSDIEGWIRASDVVII